MANKKDKKKGSVSDKKLNRLHIEQKLESALAGLKPVIGKKKFERRIKKAGKLLYSGFPKKDVEMWRKARSVDKQANGLPQQNEPAISDLP